MIANAPFVAIIVAGGLVGLGVFVLVLQLVPTPPALGPALRRLHPVATAGNPQPMVGWLRGKLQVPHADLRILGRSTDQYFLTLGLSALFGLAVPALLALLTWLLDLPLSPAIPLGTTLLVALGGVWLSHREVIASAANARAEFVRAMCTYLDLSAHQILGGHGPVESLDRAASVCHGWVFSRVRQALLSAQLQLRPPWDELKVLGVEIGVVELRDLADIMSTAGNEGADVYQTLRARADSLRDQLRTEALSDAEVRTSKLDIPASALILVLLVLLGYPFLVRLVV